jgi:TRAP-type C4-dicarboxylate transport system permease small subunit
MKKDYLGKVLSFLSVVMFFGVFFSVLTQIVTRYLPVSFTWTEELSRMFFAAAVLFCAPVAYRDYEFVIVDILIDRLPKKVRAYVELLINMGIILLFVNIFKYGIDLAINMHRQMSPTLGVHMSYFFALVPFSAVCLIYYALLNLRRLVKELRLKGQEVK